MLYMVTFTINIPPMLAYIPYMDPMGSTYKKWVRTQYKLSRLLELSVGLSQQRWVFWVATCKPSPISRKI